MIPSGAVSLGAAELWLIRKMGNHLIGPVDRSQVVEMIQQGLLDSGDELCPENSYWFSMGDLDEVRRRLGMQEVFLRQNVESDGEPTLTADTELSNAPALVAIPLSLSPSRVVELQSKVAPTGQELASQFKRPPSAIIGFPNQEREPEAHELSHIERPKVWSFILFLASVAVGVAVVMLFRVLKHS